MTDKQFGELLETAPRNLNIIKYLMVARNKLNEYRRIAVSYSGGSDSDIVLDIIELVKPDNCGEIKYVFFDTGLEWDATHRHVSEVEQRYGVTIERHKATVSIPAACAKHGVPFISKDVSMYLSLLQRNNFNWNDTSDKAIVEKYGKCKCALDWYFERRGISKPGKKLHDISGYRYLREFLQRQSPEFKISAKCCNYAKKDVSSEYNHRTDPDLCINGMRQAEGGRRVGTVKNCFTSADDKGYADYRPLWFWTDEDKQIYKEWRGVTYSDCYEKWGFKRTGCVGCPCSSSSVEQLKIAEPYEPNKVKAAWNVFGNSYRYREQYNEYKRSRQIEEKLHSGQIGGQVSL